MIDVDIRPFSAAAVMDVEVRLAPAAAVIDLEFRLALAAAVINLGQGFSNFFGPRHTISLCEI